MVDYLDQQHTHHSPVCIQGCIDSHTHHHCSHSAGHRCAGGWNIHPHLICEMNVKKYVLYKNYHILTMIFYDCSRKSTINIGGIHNYFFLIDTFACVVYCHRHGISIWAATLESRNYICADSDSSRQTDLCVSSAFINIYNHRKPLKGSAAYF